MIVTIDGPAGAGKSTVARKLAERLGFRFLDTGAMYRAVTLAALRRNVDLQDAAAIGQLANQVSMRLDHSQVFLDEVDVTKEIRTAEVTDQTRFVASNRAARAHLVQLQQRLALGQNMVTEGRDQGTVAFPNAECKFFLTASDEERARRRWEQLTAEGIDVELSEILTKQRQRDREDAARAVGPLVPAQDAVIVSTDGLTEGEVVERLAQAVRHKMKEVGYA
jgi:cytidylate kinase